MAAGRGELGGPFIGARRRRRRPTATGGEKERLGFGGKRPIRIELESNTFQAIVASDSKREKEEEISRIICPQTIRPEMEKSDGIGKRRRRGSARVSGGGGRRRKTAPTGGAHLSATEREKRAAARRTGPTWAEGEREGFGPTFGPKPKETFKNLFQFKLFMKCNSIY